MTTGEIISSVFAGLAFIISCLTAYFTLWARFRGVVLPRRRVILTQMNGEYWLLLECEFANEGAKSGLIEDIQLKMVHPDSGSQLTFSLFFTRDQFNLNQDYQSSDFTQFSGVPLGAKSRNELFVVFKPYQKNFEPLVGVVHLCVSSRNNTSGKWTASPVKFSLNLDENIIQQWSSPLGHAQQVLALEIIKSRREYLDRSH